MIRKKMPTPPKLDPLWFESLFSSDDVDKGVGVFVGVGIGVGVGFE